MTEPITEPAPDEAAEFDPTEDADLDDHDGQGDDDQVLHDATPDEPTDEKIGNEAAKYRTRLRAAETENTSLTERLTAAATEKGALEERVHHVQRGEAERLASAKLADPADLWRDGATLTDLLDEGGNVDSALVDDLAKQLAGSHPHWGIARPTRPSTPPAFRGSGASARSDHRANGLAAAFAPRND
ncbi:hypothetical protein TUM20983_20380 [Mycobacterium antarcticum]|uniref:hypothetical protein n=1 Tax=Mycolicibacterium sp. TUM20983 TaxID=3023369 RepID=UPI0023A3B28D|nr:hypothetical protein [Mycolicibacterium sp. TUM20983]GLP74928.1 hypothetical protein TUM20983_20380 [Mycolicibacterium sp. TUM20983]